MSDRLEQQVRAYLRHERNEHFRNEVLALREAANTSELQRLFGGRLTFGTAGIRGAMGAGFNRINDLVVVQTAQGLVSYLLEVFGSELCSKRGVIIGHDARHHSSRFARLAALACLQRQLPVFFCDQIVPTPLIAYGVTHFNCLAGLMITASHNPKQDNGLKVFWSNGAQILTPHDVNIQAHIMRPENQEPWSEQFSYAHELINQVHLLPTEIRHSLHLVYEDLRRSYLAYIQQLVAISEPLLAQTASKLAHRLEITYTSMHGVGHELMTSVLKIATSSGKASSSRHLHPVEAQMKADPEFPTVVLPNPEEAGALDLAFETAAKTKSTLILALDPDADRCATGLYDPASGQRRLLTGNELGQLLGWWAWHLMATNRQARSSGQQSTSSTTSFSSQATQQTNDEEDENYDASQLERAQSIETDKTPATPIRKSEIIGPISPSLVHQPQKRSMQTSSSSTKVACSKTPAPCCKPEDCYMLSTAVSSRFLDTLARHEGFHFVETLTGFKYMGNLADELMKRNKRVLFAYEEALGYLVDAHILDKDGLSASLQVVRCATYLASLEKPRTLVDQLDWLYWKYGYHFSVNSYFKCEEQRVIRAIFHELQSNYPKSFKCSSAVGCEEFVITRLRDLNTGIDNGTPDHKARLPTSASSFMVTFWVGEQIRFTIRTSGTEPKIKYYSEIVTSALSTGNTQPPTSTSCWDEGARKALEEQKRHAQARLKRFLEVALERCLKPAHYKLERPLA